jgi:ribosome-binding factor A
METKRQRQVAELVKRNFSMVLQSEGVYIYGSAPLVTVTEVKMSPDMGIAKIYLSIWNTENKQAVLLQMQEENTRLRQGLAQRLKRHVRRIPYIDFYEDETIDEMYRVDSLFDRLHEEKQMGEEGGSTEPEE